MKLKQSAVDKKFPFIFIGMGHVVLTLVLADAYSILSLATRVDWQKILGNKFSFHSNVLFKQKCQLDAHFGRSQCGQDSLL